MNSNHVLGLDIGVASIGWSIVRVDDAGEPVAIERMGVHLFEAGVEGNLERGQDESKAAPRRAARLMRRQLWRKRWRRRRVLRELMRASLLTQSETRDHLVIDQYLKGLDVQLRAVWEASADHRERQVLPYRLRAEAIRRRLEPVEVGRALYHLAQRRGFLSNRKSKGKDDEELGAVKSGITELEQKMAAAGCRTLGAYFATLDPMERRIRGRWTSRQMYLEEFEAIWTEQSTHHPALLTPEARARIHDAIFHQRPLKSQAHLIGHCDLLPGKRRAPIACRLAQRVRMLQRVNDLLIEFPDRTQRPLTREERESVVRELERGDATFTHLRSKRVLGLPKGAVFNLERGGEKRLPGLRTESKIRAAIGDQWDGLSDGQKDELIDDLLAIDNEDMLARCLRDRWHVPPGAARDLAAEPLEEDRSAHCRSALAKLLVRLEDGTPYATARREEFPERFQARAALEVLRPVRDAVPDLANPTVERALTEVRKLVNAIIRRYGKPVLIHVELARDLKKGRKGREDAWRENRQREAERERIAAQIAREAKVANPRSYDIERALLWQECGGICPYTGKPIPFRALFGPESQFDVEHIWPYSVSLDNSFLNKTLCYHEENRARKKNRTPYEAYHGTPTWDAILQRVGHFGGDERTAREKLKRFKAEELPDGFGARHLNDTRYLSRLAGEYLAELYGGRAVEGQKQRVVVTTGGLTSYLRNLWQLPAALGGERKDRSDHRHHAIDALVVALTSQRTIQVLQRAAERASEEGRRLLAKVAPPWGESLDEFITDVRRAAAGINVSHRQSRAVSGQLHADTFYSRDLPRGRNDSRPRIRKALASLNARQVKDIVDSTVRRAVEARLAELGETDPSKAFKDDASLPAMPRSDGKRVPVRKVRVYVTKRPDTIGAPDRPRRVALDSNHHTVLFSTIDAEGRTRWEDVPASLLDVYRRARNRRPIVEAGSGAGRRFLFSLAPGEFVMVRGDEGADRLCRVLSISKGDIEVCLHTDARPSTERTRDRIRLRGAALSSGSFRKVHVTYLGEIRNAGG